MNQFCVVQEQVWLEEKPRKPSIIERYEILKCLVSNVNEPDCTHTHLLAYEDFNVLYSFLCPMNNRSVTINVTMLNIVLYNVPAISVRTLIRVVQFGIKVGPVLGHKG